MTRAVRDAVDEYGPWKCTLVTLGSTDPPTSHSKAVDATAAGQLIYAEQHSQARKETNYS
ncbi:hypothetical protein E1J17_00570 [Kocuria rosea]|nr:hypothetical protein [Kocuria rosea]THE19484.1 hypothetical protein E1J17_00570 [Kocuria rosea]